MLLEASPDWVWEVDPGEEGPVTGGLSGLGGGGWVGVLGSGRA